MATPALRALRRHFAPPDRLIGIMRPYLADVLAGTHWFDEQLYYDPRSRAATLRGWRFVRRLRQARLSTAVLLTNSLRTGWLAFVSGAAERIGYVRYGRGLLLNRKLYPPRDGRKLRPTPAVDYYLDLAYALGCPAEDTALELATLAQDERAADEVWEKLRLPSGDRVIVFNSSGAYGAAKLWPAEYFAELACRVVATLDRHVLVICGPNEREIAREIVYRASDRRVVGLTDERLSIGLSKACVRRAGLMVTTDSGPRHFAAAFDVPVITLFGPTHVAWSETHYAGAVHLQREVPCGPCQQRVCPLVHHRCMRELSVDEVYAAVERLLVPKRAARAA
jgi:heptosyltransferase-2